MSEFGAYPPVIDGITDWNELLDHGLEKTAAFILRKSGSNFQAINGSTGKKLISDTDARTVGQAAINAMTSAGRLHLKGVNFPINGAALQVDGNVTPAILITGERWERGGSFYGSRLSRVDAGNLLEISNQCQVAVRDVLFDLNDKNGHGIVSIPPSGGYGTEFCDFDNLLFERVAAGYYGMYLKDAFYSNIGSVYFGKGNDYFGGGIKLENTSTRNFGNSKLGYMYCRLNGTGQIGLCLNSTVTTTVLKHMNLWEFGWVQIYGNNATDGNIGIFLDNASHNRFNEVCCESIQSDIKLDATVMGIGDRESKANYFGHGYLTAGEIAIQCTQYAKYNVFENLFTWTNIGAAPQMINDAGDTNTFRNIFGGIGYTTPDAYAASTRLEGIIKTTPADYQTQTGSWADPTGPAYNGRKVAVYNSTQAAYRLYVYSNGGWRYSALT